MTYNLRQTILPLLAGLTLALIGGGCDLYGGDVVDLVAPDEARPELFTLTFGQQLTLRWPADSDHTYWLANRNRVTGAEKVIDSAAINGRHVWIVPEDLDPMCTYDLRAYDGATSELVAQSAPYRVSAAGDIGSNGVVNACSADGECNDGLYCNGVELCTGGACTNGVAPCAGDAFCDEQRDRCWTPCLTDAQCESNAFCSNGACVERDVVSNGLVGYVFDAASGVSIDFTDSILVGQDLRILGPDSATATAGTTAASTDTAAPRALDGACSCAWRVDPPSAGIFNAVSACSNGFVATEVGDLTLIVDVDCGADPIRYTQAAYAADPPPPLPCSTDADCPSTMACSNSICVEAPPGPTIQILEEITETPYVVRFALRLLDADGAVIADGVTPDHFTIRENGAPLDLGETNQFVTAGPNLPMRVVLVLDYSRSMQNAHAVAPMIQAATQFVSAEHFTGTHEIAIVEFHDRTAAGSGFSTVVPLTAADADGKAAIIAAIPGVHDLEAGLSRVWDALESAIAVLQAVERKDGEVQAIVFLTDGRDTSSSADPDALGQIAADQGIRLFPIGFGEIPAGAARLRTMAEDTGGTYFEAGDTTALLGVFAEVADDLRGQWNLSYITPRSGGSVNVEVDFTWAGRIDTVDTTFDAGQLAGEVNAGRIQVLDRVYDPFAEETQFLLRAAYLPRNIDRMQLQFAHRSAAFVLQAEGGLMNPSAGWSSTSVGGGGFVIFGESALEFGAFGNIGIVTVPGDVPQLQVTHADSIYDAFAQPKTMVFEGDLWAAPFTLTTAVAGPANGVIVVSPDKPGYGYGEVVTLTAIAADGLVFDKWSGASTATTTTIQLTLTADAAVTAAFEAVE